MIFDLNVIFEHLLSQSLLKQSKTFGVIKELKTWYLLIKLLKNWCS